MPTKIPEIKPCPWCNTVPFLSRSYSRSCLIHNCEVIQIKLGWGYTNNIIARWNSGLETVETNIAQRNTQQPHPNSALVIDDGGSVDMSRYPSPDKQLEIL
jgi:hypothetical protein